LKDKIVVYIKNIGDSNKSEKIEKDLNFLDEFSDKQKYPEKKERIREPSQELSIKDIGRKNVDNIAKIDIEVNGEYDKLTREELINKIKQSELDNNHLQKIISSLKTRIKELEEELAELKAEEKTPEIRKEI